MYDIVRDMVQAEAGETDGEEAGARLVPCSIHTSIACHIRGRAGGCTFVGFPDPVPWVPSSCPSPWAPGGCAMCSWPHGGACTPRGGVPHSKSCVAPSENTPEEVPPEGEARPEGNIGAEGRGGMWKWGVVCVCYDFPLGSPIRRGRLKQAVQWGGFPEPPE